MTERFDPSQFSVSLSGRPVPLINQRSVRIRSVVSGLCALLAIWLLPFNHWVDWVFAIFFSLSALFGLLLSQSKRVINIHGFNKLTHDERVEKITIQLMDMPGHHDRHVAIQVRTVGNVTGIFANT